MTSSHSEAAAPVQSSAIREHLTAVLKSPKFSKSRRLQRFLEFIVERELTGHREEIQEYGIGLDVFDRKESFDPRADSIVRVEARRLRQRLAEYYAEEGVGSPIRIVLPERGYVPSFERQNRVRRGRVTPAAVTAGLIGAIWAGVSLTPWTTSPHEPTPPAHEAFEKGLAAYKQWTGDGAHRAEEFFHQAIAYDPEYARAYAWLSAAYRQQSIMGDSDFGELHPKSAEAAQTAVALDPQLAEARQMLGVSLTFEPEWADAEEAFRVGIRFGPDNADIHHAYGIVLLAASASRLAEAESELRDAVRLEPGNLGHRVVLGKVLYFRGRFEEARAILEEALRIDAHYPDAMRNLAAVLVQTGDYAEAIRLFERAQQLAYLSWGDGLLGHALAVSGRREEARAILTDLESRFDSASVAALAIANIHVGLEESGSACDWLARAWERREMRIRYVSVDPIYVRLREQSCFVDLSRRMKLDELARLNR